MFKPRFVTLMGMVLAAAVSRLLPHPPNVTPVAAMALFAGAHFSDRRAAFLIPLAAMLLSDLIIGWHALMPIIYGSFALTVCLGFCLRQRRKTYVLVGGAALTSSLIFFLTTNLGVWALGGMYPKTLAGLMTCYLAAIPFFGHTLLGDMAYAGILFGSFALAERGFPLLREPATA